MNTTNLNIIGFLIFGLVFIILGIQDFFSLNSIADYFEKKFIKDEKIKNNGNRKISGAIFIIFGIVGFIVAIFKFIQLKR